MKLPKKIGLIFWMLHIAIGSVVAQTYESNQPHMLEFTWSNDFVFSTDRYYSNGLALTYYFPALRKSPVNYVLLPSKNASRVYYGLSITQDFFTPIELFSLEIDRQDRPFASYVLLGQRKISLNEKTGFKVHSEIQIGLLGKYSGGQSIQNGIHELLPPSDPALGWPNQIQPDLALNYIIRMEKSIIQKKSFGIIPVVDLNAGIPYTNAGASVIFRIGRMNNYFSDIGLDKSMSWQLYFFTEMGGKYVFYNATLQGGLISQNPYVMSKISPWVGTIKSGIAFTYKKFGLEIGQQFITPEFNEGLSHNWGYITFKVNF